MKLRVNGDDYTTEASPEMPLLWVLRDELGLTGTKYGCGIASCGACTVHIDGRPRRSCTVRLGDVDGDVITIEGLGGTGATHPVQRAWITHQVAQCGYCQSGQILAAAALIERHPEPTDEQIDRAMSANLCRCGTYVRIRAAIKAAARLSRDAVEGTG